MLQSEDDPSVPILLTNALYERLCAIGTEVDYRVFEGLGHDETSKANVALMLEWTAARFAGNSTSPTCE
jgi:predicted esterase